MTPFADGAAVAEDVHEKADVVVVGSGAGGAVVARELAARGRDVVLLEEGGYFTGKDFTGNPREMIDLLYRNRGLTGAFGRPPIPIPLGRCVGGTTTINSGTCYRAPDYVLDEWAERYGVAGAREPDLRAYFERVEAELGVRPVPEDTYGRNSRLFERGAAALGYDGARIPRNERGCLGTGVCAIGCPQDAKQAMHVSYVPRAQAAGARLYTRCRVDRVLLSGGRAIGVIGRFVDASERETARELCALARHVVVACGALLTPALLERSGVSDPSGQRGRNLHIHPATRVGALFDEEVRGWEEVPQAYNVHHFTREGIFIQGQFVPPALEAPARSSRTSRRAGCAPGAAAGRASPTSSGRPTPANSHAPSASPPRSSSRPGRARSTPASILAPCCAASTRPGRSSTPRFPPPTSR